MTVFLTSSPTGPLDNSRPVDGLDRMNSFVENLAARWPHRARCLMIAAGPEDLPLNDEMTSFMAWAFAHAGLSISGFDLWDARTENFSGLEDYDVVFLGGGHVPTQNAFFQRISLKEKLTGFSGLVMGISAGTMNAARLVYAQPELPGEALDPHYVRFLPGLGLTELNLLPHYQMVRNNLLDGLRLYEDITCGDSMGRAFLAIPDGSYVLVEHGSATLWGEGFRIADGHISPMAAPGQVTDLAGF